MKNKDPFEIYKVEIPEGESGIWKVERFTISKEDADRHNAYASCNFTDRLVKPGSYTRLMRGKSWDNPIMSDTYIEIQDHFEPIERAKGLVLINGLGIGMVANGCLMKNEVEKVIVVEFSEDVIKLVAPFYKDKYGDRFEVIQANAYEYQPPKGIRYGMVWSDVWDNICSDNWEDYKKLKKKYSRRSEWYGAWAEDETKYAR